MPVFYYSLQLSVCDSNFSAFEIFVLESNGEGGGGRSLGLFYCLILSGMAPLYGLYSSALQRAP